MIVQTVYHEDGSSTSYYEDGSVSINLTPEQEKRLIEDLDNAVRVPPSYITDPDTRYNKVYDAYYNVNTREWLEEPCGDDDCEFCARRPDLAPMEE